ncbi:MAG TPA: ABC transporter substrate-binding protein [Solirubrobacterales bacterium]|nr:ABC transporter substrate-binding protein [Solirubrobacterales bacterium]
MTRGALRRGRLPAIVAAAACVAALVAGCGGDDRTVGGSATVEMSTPPDYLDPQLGYTTEAAEADWIAYTPLLTYRHKEAPGGTELIPGLAARLPHISPNGKRYVFTLRRGLVYSNGTPVTASDFEYTIERAIRLGWGGKRFITQHVAGAREFDRGEATDIAGIQADDASGRIEILLRHPYGPFANVLALPATGLVPSGTPMKDLSLHPPPGVGAYRITEVVPNRAWTMVNNPGFERLDIPDVPIGSLDRIKVRINPNRAAAADEVIGGGADAYDPGTPLPAVALNKARAVAEDRFEPVPIPSTFYFFLNSTTTPFNSELARRAVITALDRPALARLSNQTVEPECFLLPDGIPGHPSSSCPYGTAGDDGDLQEARDLVEMSRTAGTPVRVWGENSPPQRAFVRRYVKLLRQLGYRADARLVQPSGYFAKVGAPETSPQTGFASWFNDFPNPADFYEVLDARSISAHGANLGRVDDIFIQQQLAGLNLVPATQLSRAAGRWRELDEYTAKKSYLAVFGTQQVPKLMSERVNFGSAVIHPLFLSDWSTWSLRQ